MGGEGKEFRRMVDRKKRGGDMVAQLVLRCTNGCVDVSINMLSVCLRACVSVREELYCYASW